MKIRVLLVSISMGWAVSLAIPASATEGSAAPTPSKTGKSTVSAQAITSPRKARTSAQALAAAQATAATKSAASTRSVASSHSAAVVVGSEAPQEVDLQQLFASPLPRRLGRLDVDELLEPRESRRAAATQARSHSSPRIWGCHRSSHTRAELRKCLSDERVATLASREASMPPLVEIP
jgi:hypothetical protein